MSITLCRFWVKAESEPRFVELLRIHWPTFQRLGLVAEHPPHLIFRGEDQERGVFYVETFAWRDEAAMHAAHSSADVMAIWGPMNECCTSMEFPTVTHIEL